MHNDHILRCKFHFLFVKNIEILHADIILFIEETFFLYTGHIKDIQLRKCIFQTFYFFEFYIVFLKDIFADVAWYTKLFRNRIIMQSVYTTLLVSLLATIIATVAGTFAAIGFYAMRRRVRNPLMTVNNIPMMNADIVTGVSMCLLFVAFFSGWGSFASWFNTLGLFRLPTHLTMGFGTLLIAHITFNIPYVILSVGPKLRQMDRNLVDAAMDLGCTWMQAFWKVIIPEIKPGIVSGALTAFTMSIDDFVISYFTAGSSSSTLAMTIYGMTKKKVTPEINAISTLLFVTVLVLLAVINIREARQERKLAAEQRR